MATYLSSNITATVPALTDDANVVAAFQDYHASIADDIDSRASKTSPSITGTITASGIITANAGTITASTVTLVGQANAAIAAGRYIAGTGTANVLANTSSAVRVFISQANPNGCTAALTTGDLWISWT